MSDTATERQIPLTLIAVGFVAYAIAAFTHAGTGGVAPVLIAVLIGGIVQTLLLIVAAFLVASLLSISFGDFNSAILKFAGATLAAGGIGALVPGVGGLVGSLIFLCLILWLFELELPYAFALTIGYYVVAFVAAIILRAVLA